jgi:hypothetical protein
MDIGKFISFGGFMKRSNLVILSGVVFLLSACAQGSSYRQEMYSLSGVSQVGNSDLSGLSNADIKRGINRAYLDGELTAEQARKAHIQLDVRGHQTAEEIAIINRDRLDNRGKYETNKESLDVLRDVTSTGSSMVSDVRDVRYTIQSLFR